MICCSSVMYLLLLKILFDDIGGFVYYDLMSNDILSSIETLSTKVRKQEEETNALKRVVNSLCEDAKVPPRYPNISSSAQDLNIRKDQYYGQPLNAALRSYLEYRKAANLGPASIGDIFQGIKSGGYKFETKSDDIAKIGVAAALRKTSSVFHRLPTGEYGLLAWYPNAKAATTDNAEDEKESTKKTAAKRGKGHKAAKADEEKDGDSTEAKADDNSITAKEVRDVILAAPGEFELSTVEAVVKTKYTGRTLQPNKVSNVLFILKKKGLIKEVSPKVGLKAAVYAKA